MLIYISMDIADIVCFCKYSKILNSNIYKIYLTVQNFTTFMLS